MSASLTAVRRATTANKSVLGRGRTIPRAAMRSTSMHLMRNSWDLAARDNISFVLFTTARRFSTETHSSVNGSLSGPPPGFDAEKAKIPLPSQTTAGGAKTPASAKTKTASEEAKKATTAASAAAARKAPLAEAAGKSPAADVATSEEKPAVALEAKDAEKAEPKLSLVQKIKHEAQHYWDGTKLLATEVKISTRLAVKMAAGYELTRRENRQLQRTVQDLSRLVPFSVFVIVPFAELLLPVALKLFPNMLPSTYEGQQSREKKASFLRATRKEVSTFLRQTMKETGLPIQSGTAHRAEFTNFFRKVRATGEQPTAEDVIKVCKIFKDDLTLDNLSRPQLVSMCRYMNLNTFGTDMMLRYQVRHRMRQIKRDDRAISYEGVDSLTVAELQTACASRGIKSYGVSPARLREDLQTWLDLRLKEGVPSTLLVLSNAYMYGQPSTGKSDGGAVQTQIEALTGVLSSIPEELYHEIELAVHNAEGAATNKQRLEVLKEQEDLIEDEAEQNQVNQKKGLATPRDVDNIDEKEEQERQQQQQQQAAAAAADKAVEAAQVTQAGEAVDAEKDKASAVLAQADKQAAGKESK